MAMPIAMPPPEDSMLKRADDDVAMVDQTEEEMIKQADMDDIETQTRHKFYKEPNRRISRWEDQKDRAARSGWGAPTDKTFTP